MIGENLLDLLPFFKKSAKQAPIPQADLVKTDRITYILSEFNSHLEALRESMDRSSESWNLYKGYGGSSYSKELRDKFKSEGRNPFEGNIIRSKVDGLAGGIVKNFFDVAFEPVNGEHSHLTRYMKELMLIDKELLDWNHSYLQLIIDGLIHQGVEEMYIDYKYSPYGNIGFRNIQPNHLLIDPTWLSNSAWDLKKAFKTTYMTPLEMEMMYPEKKQEIHQYVMMKSGKPSTIDNGDTYAGVNHHGLNEVYGDQYRVIEYHHMEVERKTKEIITATGQEVPEGSDDFKKEWAILNNVDLSLGVMKQTFDVDVYYVTTICPGLSRTLVLQDKQGLIQIGRLPFFPWSAARINGINSGIPDLLKSIQQTYNYRESLLDYQISTSAAGFQFIDPLIVDGDENKMREVVENWNKPKGRMWTAPGALASGRQYVQALPTTPMDYGVVQEITRMIDMADRVSKQNATMDGRSEGSEETSILFARKQMQAEITQAVITKSLEFHWNEKGEAYFLLAKQLYSGVYRKFYSNSSKQVIELNVPTITPSGEVIENDISMLPRLKVIISESPEGVTTRSVDRSINTELLRVLGPENPLKRALISNNVMKTLNNNKSEREKYEEAGELEYQLAKESVMTQLLGLKTQQVQMQQQMMGGMQPPPEEGGQPPEQEAPQAPGNPAQNVPGSNDLMNQQMAQ